MHAITSGIRKLASASPSLPDGIVHRLVTLAAVLVSAVACSSTGTTPPAMTDTSTRTAPASPTQTVESLTSPTAMITDYVQLLKAGQ